MSWLKSKSLASVPNLEDSRKKKLEAERLLRAQLSNELSDSKTLTDNFKRLNGLDKKPTRHFKSY